MKFLTQHDADKAINGKGFSKNTKKMLQKKKKEQTKLEKGKEGKEGNEAKEKVPPPGMFTDSLLSEMHAKKIIEEKGKEEKEEEEEKDEGKEQEEDEENKKSLSSELMSCLQGLQYLEKMEIQNVSNAYTKASSSCFTSSSIISLQRSTHSLQIYTLGPAISFLTSS